MEMQNRRLFLKWTLFAALSVVGLVVIGMTYGNRISGPSAVAIPAILAVYVYASGYAGHICWQATLDTPRRTMHRARYLDFWAWLLPMVGILSTALGFWLMLTAGGNDQDLHDRILAGGGVALSGTFVGVYTSVVLKLFHRIIEHEID